MLHKYAFSNFQSFRDRTEVSWQPDRKVPNEAWTAPSAAGGERLSTIMAVIGANASGKTGLLKALIFMNWFMGDSFRDSQQSMVRLFPHAASEGAPSEFEKEFDFEGQLWRYELRATLSRVLHEALYVKKQRMGYVFIRTWNDAEKTYEVKQQNLGFSPSEAVKVRPNASLISTAAQYGVPLAQKIAQEAVRMNCNINEMGKALADRSVLQLSAQHFLDNPVQREQMVDLLSKWDLGLRNVLIKKIDGTLTDGSPSSVLVPYGVHKMRNGDGFEVPFTFESSGTQGAFVLLANLLSALAKGGLAVIDELENDLHPHMLEPILDLFANKDTNPHGAQLLFTCHAVQVLNMLHKSQVTLVEKDEHNESRAWRLGDMQGVRNDDNLYGKYMAGAYGATPYL